MHFYRPPLRELHVFTFDLDDTLHDNRSVIAHTEYESVQFLQRYHPALHCLGQGPLSMVDYQRLRRELRQREPEIYHDVSHIGAGAQSNWRCVTWDTVSARGALAPMLQMYW